LQHYDHDSSVHAPHYGLGAVDVLDEPDVLDVQAEELAAGVPVVGLDARVVAVGPVDGTSVVWQKAQPIKQVCKATTSVSYFSLFGWNCVV
jgi:hypothetical protein